LHLRQTITTSKDDDVVVVTPMEDEEERVSHAEATGAIDMLRNYMTSLEMPQDCFMTLARLQRQIVQQRQKATVQQPSISSMFPRIRKK
jgi:hypothetical protein